MPPETFTRCPHPSTAQAQSPTEYIGFGKGPPSKERLAVTLTTMGQSYQITPIQYDTANTTLNYRVCIFGAQTRWTFTRSALTDGAPKQVQGRAYFRPDLRKWPFDTQELEIMVEDLEQTLHSVVYILPLSRPITRFRPNSAPPNISSPTELQMFNRPAQL